MLSRIDEELSENIIVLGVAIWFTRKKNPRRKLACEKFLREVFLGSTPVEEGEKKEWAGGEAEL